MLSWNVLCLPCITYELQWLNFLCLQRWILPGFPGDFPEDSGWSVFLAAGNLGSVYSVSHSWCLRPLDTLAGFRFFLFLPWHRLFLSFCKWCLNLGLGKLFLFYALEWLSEEGLWVIAFTLALSCQPESSNSGEQQRAVNKLNSLLPEGIFGSSACWANRAVY